MDARSSSHTEAPRRGALPPVLEARLAALTPDQREAATAPPGPVLCVAPAGSGKTTTLVARVAWRIALGADAGAVCAVTFNRRAAEELGERLAAALVPLGIEPGAVRVRTFHALGREILADAGVDVTDLVDRAVLIADLAGATPDDPLPAAATRYLDDAFSRLKLDPERGPAPSDRPTHAAFAAYQAALAERGALDFDDLVARAGPALEGDAALLARWRERTRVLFVDEAQDLDRAQLELALLLAGEARDIFLVGDDDQTIYAWRLADVRRVLTLAARLPGLRRVDLVTNHRCPPEVVRRAARLVACNGERFAKRIEPSPRAWGHLALVADPGDPVSRARALLGRWAQDASAAAPERGAVPHPDGGPDGQGAAATAQAGTPPGHAVLARTNAELAPYAAVALELGLPFSAADDGLLLDDPGLPAILGDAERLATTTPLLVAVDRAALAHSASAILRGSLLAWAAGVDGIAALRSSIDRARVVRRGGDGPPPGDATDAGSATPASAGHAAGARGGVAGPRPWLTLATVHGTKGLEWDHVACIGFDEGTFPSARSIGEASDPMRALEEERRLAYVAWTRARRTLAIVFDPGAPSPFLRDAFDPGELAVRGPPG